MAIEKVSPSSDGYNDLEEFIKTSNPVFDYKDFAKAYNGIEVEFILVFEYMGSMMSNFVKVIENRGLERYVDYEYKSTQAQTGKGTFKVVLKKLTDNKCIIK